MSSGREIGENARLSARTLAHTVFRVPQALTPGLPSSQAAFSTSSPRRGASHGLQVSLKGHDDEATKFVERAYRGTDCAANRRVLTDSRTAWHAPAMLAGTYRGRSLARSADGSTLSHARHRICGVASTGAGKGGRLETGGAVRLSGTFRGRLGARSPDGGRIASTGLGGVWR
jgi:hypothetical protein